MQFRKQYREWLSAPQTTQERERARRRSRRRKGVLVAVLTVLVLALMGGATTLVVNPTARVWAQGRISQASCGDIILPGSLASFKPPHGTLPEDAIRSINCFAAAYATCQPASISTSTGGVDTSSLDVFEIVPVPGRCALVERGDYCVDGCIIHTLVIAECAGIARLGDGLHIRGCGGKGSDRVLPARGSLLDNYNCHNLLLPGSSTARAAASGYGAGTTADEAQADITCFMTAWTYCIPGSLWLIFVRADGTGRYDLFKVQPDESGGCAVVDSILVNISAGPSGVVSSQAKVRCAGALRLADGLHFVGCELPPGISVIPVVPATGIGTPTPSTQ